MRSRSTLSLTSLLVAIVLALGLAMPATAATPEAPKGSRSLTVYHGPVEVALVDPASDGHRLGDVRVTSVATTNAAGEPIGRLEATLTTTSIDTPNVGDEQRIGVLVFSFGEGGQHQVTVQGSAHYPADGPTIASGDVTLRPVVGGSGRLFGASGDAVTTHHQDGTWSHELRLVRAGQRAGSAQRDLPGLRDRLRTRQAERRDAAAERRSERAQGRDDDGTPEERPTEREAQRAGREAQKAERATARDALKVERAAARDERKAERERADPVDAGITAGADETGVVRTDLGIAEPGVAPGEELGLWHYVIPAGEELTPHTHPGTQLAHITDGELEYTVLSGEGVLLRADGSQESMGPGTYVLATGDAVIENPELVHYGANRTDELVTILAATLYPTGEPLSTVVEEPAG